MWFVCVFMCVWKAVIRQHHPTAVHLLLHYPFKYLKHTHTQPLGTRKPATYIILLS